MYIKLGKQELEKVSLVSSNPTIQKELDTLKKLGY
jgi:hypothetical protein